MGSMWTFGHSTRSADATVALLADYGITLVVDVRSIRGSRHCPQFNAESMAAWLDDADVGYRWIKALGGRRRAQHIDPEVNAGWTHPSFHHYADYALGEDFASGLRELETLMTPPTDGAAPVRAALMCAEAVPWRCHRSLIATALVARGHQVTHILGPGNSIEHEIGAWGAAPVIDADGGITYPA